MQGETAMPTAVVVCSAFSLPKMTCKLYPLNAGCAWAPPSVGGTRTMERGTRMVHLPSLHAFRTIPIFVARMSQKVWDSLRYSVSGEHMTRWRVLYQV